MLKNQLNKYYKVLAVEVDKGDFIFFRDVSLVSTTSSELKRVIDKNKKYDVEYNKILTMIDDSISLDNDIEKDENGDILKEMTEEEIITLKNNMLDGVEEYFDSINEEF